MSLSMQIAFLNSLFLKQLSQAVLGWEVHPYITDQYPEEMLVSRLQIALKPGQYDSEEMATLAGAYKRFLSFRSLPLSIISFYSEKDNVYCLSYIVRFKGSAIPDIDVIVEHKLAFYTKRLTKTKNPLALILLEVLQQSSQRLLVILKYKMNMRRAKCITEARENIRSYEKRIRDSTNPTVTVQLEGFLEGWKQRLTKLTSLWEM